MCHEKLYHNPSEHCIDAIGHLHQEYQTFGVHELKIKVSHRVWVTQQSSMLTSLGVVVRGVAGGQGAVGWLQYRHMPTILQRLIYNLSAMAPLCFIFALLWYWQKKTMDIPCIVMCIGVALVILFMISFSYGKRHLAPIIIRTNDIAPYDSWVIMYIITYMFPFASLVIKDFNLIICVIVALSLIHI